MITLLLKTLVLKTMVHERVELKLDHVIGTDVSNSALGTRVDDENLPKCFGANKGHLGHRRNDVGKGHRVRREASFDPPLTDRHV